MSNYRRTEGDLVRHVWASTRRTDRGCWEWTRSTWDGYGQIGSREVNGKYAPMRVHQLTWRLFKGEVPEGMHLHHKCENKLCCNPDHLELLTPAEHKMRHHDPDYCVRGHAFTPENTGRKSNGGRICKKCDAERSARRRAKKSAPCVWCGKPALRDERGAEKPAECRACFHAHAVPNPNGPGKVSYFSEPVAA